MGAVAAVATIGATITAAATWILRQTIGRAIRELTGRVDRNDKRLDRQESLLVDVRLSQARTEGYLAAQNGGGAVLPSNAVSEELAAKLPDPDPELVSPATSSPPSS